MPTGCSRSTPRRFSARRRVFLRVRLLRLGQPARGDRGQPSLGLLRRLGIVAAGDALVCGLRVVELARARERPGRVEALPAPDDSPIMPDRGID